jgi:5-methylcytosine-specific restriction endonuclease McrA
MVSALRDPNLDKFKSPAVLKEQQSKNLKCKLLDCNNLLSMYEGPGSDSLCRDHQLMCLAYGGFGNPAEPHTFFRDWVCSNPLCQYDPRNDPAFNVIEELYLKLTAMRYQMHGDHIIPRALGGTDAKENIQVLCKKCHDIKSFKNGDFANKTKKVINDR